MSSSLAVQLVEYHEPLLIVTVPYFWNRVIFMSTLPTLACLKVP